MLPFSIQYFLIEIMIKGVTKVFYEKIKEKILVYHNILASHKSKISIKIYPKIIQILFKKTLLVVASHNV